MCMKNIKEFAIGLALRSGNMLMQEFHKLAPEQIRFKNKRELVTKYDYTVNRFLVSKLQQAYPQHSILSEEEGLTNSTSSTGYQWVVDPLDGTTNFIMRHAFFTTTLALLKDNKPILGIIYSPYTRELFVAERGRGAKCNEVRLHVSNEDKLNTSFLCFAYSHEKTSLQRAISAYQQFEFEARSMRHFGASSLELAFVASGRVDGMIITPPVRIWDVAAGVLLVKEAGGHVTDFSGKTANFADNGLIVSNGKVHQQIVNVIKRKKI